VGIPGNRRPGYPLNAFDAHEVRVSERGIWENLRQSTVPTPRRRSGVNQPKEPEDARKSTEEQRELQEQLEHSDDDDPDAPGLHQSHRDVADESTR
jgi:hypothetical protein